jgi:predicted nucleotidyltransferase
MNHQNNIRRIKIVFDALGALQNRVVFVGGATVSLYSDRQAYEVRETDDVDIIIELLNYSSHAEFEEQLRNIGFSHDVESGVLCRYRIHGITVDIMPTTSAAIGFSNKWYPGGFNEAVDYKIDEYQTIKILSPPYFIATKLEAFKDRGSGDGRTSQDFEDIVYVLENRRSIWKEMQNAQGVLKEYLRSEFTRLMNNPNITEWIDCHVERGSPPATYLILDEIKQFIKL